MQLKYFISLLFLSLAISLSAQDGKWAIVIHGGAGDINRENMNPEAEAKYRAALDSALDIGSGVLESGGSSMDAVEATIRYLEDCPLFNSGRGAVLTSEGTAELDASFMDGETRNAGAVAGVKTIRHPISAARLVMDSSVHVMMAGEGAEIFASDYDLEFVENEFFITERRKAYYERQKARQAGAEGGDGAPLIKKYGTVGCVARDQNGNLAAGTSTGGMSNKRFGRVGDAPIIGAGTFADNNTCAVSCTGHGEYFIRWVVAYDVAALMEYADMSLADAARRVVNEKLVEAQGSGGLIAVDGEGNVTMPFNSGGMYRGFATSEGEKFVGLYGDE